MKNGREKQWRVASNGKRQTSSNGEEGRFGYPTSACCAISRPCSVKSQPPRLIANESVTLGVSDYLLREIRFPMEMAAEVDKRAPPFPLRAALRG